MLSRPLKYLYNTANSIANAKLYSLVYNVKKTCCTAIGKQRPVNARIVLEQQAVIWKDSFRYLGIDFKCNVNIEVDVALLLLEKILCCM